MSTTPWMRIGGVEVLLHTFLTSALDWGEWSASRLGRFFPRERAPGYPLDRRLGGLQSRSGHGGEDKNFQPLLGPQPPDHPARSPVLYRWATSAPPSTTLQTFQLVGWLNKRKTNERGMRHAWRKWEMLTKFWSTNLRVRNYYGTCLGDRRRSRVGCDEICSSM
jgi:hypothetical protein